MGIAVSLMLLVNAVFNVIVWPPFLRRVRKDERAYTPEGKPTSFLRVHQVLIAIALLIAIASTVLGVVGLFTLP